MSSAGAEDRTNVALLELRLDRSSDPIEGRLSIMSRSEVKSSWEFVGWLAFVRAVEAALAADDPGASGQTGPDDPAASTGR